MVSMLKDTLLQQFDACYDRNEWFVAVKNAVTGLTAEQADWKPDGAQHSIRELINHLSHDNNAFLQRFQGFEYKSPAANNAETFNPVGGNWEADLARFESVMTDLREVLQEADETKLDETVAPRNEKRRIEIANLNAHNAYHGGQIVLLRKLQESWDPGSGVS
jgi:uncharacterized damage-inducible protein DinB